jgi:hypothetical protein
MNSKELDVLMVIEGEIAITHLIEQVLSACTNHGIRYRKRFLERFSGNCKGI